MLITCLDKRNPIIATNKTEKNWKNQIMSKFKAEKKSERSMAYISTDLNHIKSSKFTLLRLLCPSLSGLLRLARAPDIGNTAMDILISFDLSVFCFRARERDKCVQ